MRPPIDLGDGQLYLDGRYIGEARGVIHVGTTLHLLQAVGAAVHRSDPERAGASDAALEVSVMQDPAGRSFTEEDLRRALDGLPKADPFPARIMLADAPHETTHEVVSRFCSEADILEVPLKGRLWNIPVTVLQKGTLQGLVHALGYDGDDVLGILVSDSPLKPEIVPWNGDPKMRTPPEPGRFVILTGRKEGHQP